MPVYRSAEMVYPKNYTQAVRKIMSRLFRVFVHVYIHHFERLCTIGAVSECRWPMIIDDIIDIAVAGGPREHVLQAFLFLRVGIRFDRQEGARAIGESIMRCCIRCLCVCVSLSVCVTSGCCRVHYG